MANKKTKQNIDYRYLARIVIEATMPLAVHSGEKMTQTDAVVIKDANGLPYIPGSSIAGVIRHAWKDANKDVENIFGFQKKTKSTDDKETNGMGSRLIFTEARILNSQGKVVDGLQPDAMNDVLLKEYEKLPVRQHVRITHRGVAADKGKFDEQIVYAGTRFCFEMELLGTEDEKEVFQSLLDILKQSTFRLGGGSRKGFGKIQVVEVLNVTMKLIDEKYLRKPSDLEKSKAWYVKQQDINKEENKDGEDKKNKTTQETSMLSVSYELRPQDFFLFGSGFGDDDADMTPVKEKKVIWKINGDQLDGSLGDYLYLIPATSVKGALSHRVAFYYNKLTEFFADGKSEKEIKEHTGTNNEAVKLLFGCEGDENGEGKMRGNVIISDMYLKDAIDKIFNHVAIDRFTGGAIEGALFTEKTGYWHHTDDSRYPLKLNVLIDMNRMKKTNEKIYPLAVKALNAAIKDLCSCMLPLGGGVNKGHGIFEGKWTEIKA